MYKTRMSSIHLTARVRASHHYLPDVAMHGAFFTVLRSGWLDSAPGGGVSRLECPGDDVLYCLSGKGTVEIDGKTFDVGQGQLVWIPGEAPHSHRADERDPWSVMWLRMYGPDNPALRRRLFGAGRPRMTIAESGEMIAWFHRLFDTMAARSADADLRLNADVADLLRLLARQRDSAVRPSLPPALSRLHTAIMANPEAPWSSDDMQRYAGMSSSQLRRLFQKHFATTPRAYLRRARLAMAQRLLLESSRTLSEIAFDCGFFDAYHLSRDFKRVIGRPPSEWRRLEQGL